MIFTSHQIFQQWINNKEQYDSMSSQVQMLYSYEKGSSITKAAPKAPFILKSDNPSLPKSRHAVNTSLWLQIYILYLQ